MHVHVFHFVLCKYNHIVLLSTRTSISLISSVMELSALPSSQVMGSLADKKCIQGQRVSGILVKKNFNYHILNPSDLSSEFESVGKSFMRINFALFCSTQGVMHQSVNLPVSILCPQRTQSWP